MSKAAMEYVLKSMHNHKTHILYRCDRHGLYSIKSSLGNHSCPYCGMVCEIENCNCNSDSIIDEPEGI